MVITYTKHDVTITSNSLGTIKGKDMLHYLVANLLVKSSTIINEQTNIINNSRTIVLANEAEKAL